MEATIKREYKKGDVRLFPTHQFVSNWVFSEGEELQAELCHVMAKVAELNDLDANDMHHLFPAVLRMLKDKSSWSN